MTFHYVISQKSLVHAMANGGVPEATKAIKTEVSYDILKPIIVRLIKSRDLFVVVN